MRNISSSTTPNIVKMKKNLFGFSLELFVHLLAVKPSCEHNADISSTFKSMRQICLQTVAYLRMQQLQSTIVFQFASSVWPADERKSNCNSLVAALFLVSPNS